MKKNLILVTLVALISTGVSCRMLIKKFKKKIEEYNVQNKKWAEFYELLLLWLELRQRGYNLGEYFSRKPYRTVAVYGMKELGERLCQELEELNIEVKYLIDKNAESVYTKKVVYKPDDNLPDVDVIIVTAIHYYAEIEESMSSKMDCPVINLTDVIYEALSYSMM